MKRVVALSLIILAAVTACKKKSSLSIVPVISLIGMTPDSIKLGSGEDTAYISFTLVDGDADLGNDKNGQHYDIYLKDSRVDTFSGYFFPDIDANVENPAKGLKGTCVFKINGATAAIRQDSLHVATGDTASYELYISDRAGHESNHIFTNKLYLRP